MVGFLMIWVYNMDNYRKFNKLQTELTESLINSLNKEEQADLFEMIDAVMFIQNLTAVDRKRAKDLERWDFPGRPLVKIDENSILRKLDPKGRIVVDITNPHILEDMDYFREAAIFFNNNGVYTRLHPNRNPNSEFFKHWKEEARRCREGYFRPSDGEWIPGFYYFYLNYSPILKVEIVAGTNRAGRVEAFPNVYDGDYLFYHYLEQARNAGKHTATLKKRGSGFSFKGGSKLARNFIVGESESARHKIKSYAVANEKEYLTKDGVLNKFLAIADFCAINTGFPGVRTLKDSLNDMHWKMGRKDSVTGTDKGTLNEVMGVTLKNDAEKARGKRGSLIEWEEAGKFDNFLTAWGIARPSVEEDGFAFGIMNAYGTGGTEGAAFDGLEEIFYNGEGYNIYSLSNVFDKNTGGKGRCSFFFGTYMNFKGKYDDNGNSDVIGALILTVKDRLKTKYGASDPNAIVQKKAENPITPQEAIMRTEGSAFPVGDLRDYLDEIMPQIDRFVDEHWIGNLTYDSKGKVNWSLDNTITPIRDFPYIVKGGKSSGAVEIFDMPQKDRDGKIFSGRYIAGIDPIDNDYTVNGSLASIMVFDMWTDKIVAEYTARPVLAEEFYEICLRLTSFYNAEANYENNLKGLFSYFSNHNSLHLLCDTPEILRDMDIVKTNLYGNRSKGTRTTKEVIKLGKTLQRQWMMSQYEIELYNEDDNETQTTFIQNLRRIRSIGYIKECIAWNPDINADRVSAMDMVMILREDKAKMVDKFEERSVANINTATGDEFLDANWAKAIGTMNEGKLPWM
jgi:hypothetical protein